MTFQLPYQFLFQPTNFTSVGDMVDAACVLLQDVDHDRYALPSVYAALNAALVEAKKYRPDFYRGLASTPQYSIGDSTAPINFPEEYRVALVRYIAGTIQLQDNEDVSDQRATVLLNTYTAKLLSMG